MKPKGPLARYSVVRFGPVSGAAVALLFVLGCGGGGGDHNGGNNARGEVSGVVFDGNGQPVRGATVFVDQGGTRETVTDSLGAYVLRDVVAEDLLVGAQTPDGAYVGQNLARVYEGERDVSVNIALYSSGSLARIVGRVTNGQGRAVGGLRVFARPTNTAVLSSASALTDGNGNYTIDRLARNVEYRLLTNDLGKGEGTTVLTPSVRETRQDLVLGTASNPNLAAPAGLYAIAYTTTGAETTSRSVDAGRQARAMEAVKRVLDPKRTARLARKTGTRNTTFLNEPISIDLFWNEYTATDTYGFGIYRSLGTGAAANQTFLHDPLAAYFDDGDEALVDGNAYTYRITAISSSYDENSGTGESSFSNATTVTPLSELLLGTPSGQTVSWQAVSGAAAYTVFAYDRYPDLGVQPISTTKTTTTSLTIPGNLSSGARYYYVVVATRYVTGSTTDASAQALSPVDSFVR